jgi:hypothetical protein
MMDLIDRNELEPDTEWSDYYDGYMSYSQSQINGAPTVKAIPLDKVKQAREEITKQFVDLQDGSEEWRSYVNETVLECVEIMDKLIAESEE